MLTPEYISGLINFFSINSEPDWVYNPNKTDMRNLQVKGSARVFNLLEKKGIALLADEVGMGKTIQSLAVCSAIWKENPKARILVIAPREEIARNWEKEYQNFINHHYRHNDDLIKTVLGNDPVKQMIYCPNLYSLVNEIQQGWGQFFVGKISSFSSLMSQKDIIGRLESLGISQLRKIMSLSANRNVTLNNEIIKKLRSEIFNYSDGKPFFDLVIIDEAHYLRNRDGDSLRVNSAKHFFGDPTVGTVPIAKKVLLLTATPNHSSSDDIHNIVSYFTNDFYGKSYKQILNTICIRRLRRLGNQGYSKYHYRHEEECESSFKNSPFSEMFFGLYQQRLATAVNQGNLSRKGRTGVSQIMKYLEGVEFIPFHQLKEISLEDEEEDRSTNSADFKEGSDSKILRDLSQKYYKIFSKLPEHPKYERLVADLYNSNKIEKAVVFVRRIPSVFEISKRIIEKYDLDMWCKMQQHGLEYLSYSKLDRASFVRLVKSIDKEANLLDEDIDESQGLENEIPECKVLNLFRIVKSDPVIYTPAAFFRNRFNHSKPGIFNMFFSPGQDYYREPYIKMDKLYFEVGRKVLENYYFSALQHRVTNSKNLNSKDILNVLMGRNSVKSESVEISAIPTLFTTFWELFESDETISAERRKKVVDTYKNFSIYEKESFSNFIEKGSILASEAIIEFYKYFRLLEIKVGTGDQVSIYIQFCDLIKGKLREMRLYLQIQESILHFRDIYTKVFSINGEKKLLSEAWDNFNNSQPIYPYNAANKSINVRNNFNTPFFPDILVATSVLQEGVNLQFFCDKVYHYGVAWTPGDNEQRVGRIDRMFSKVERELNEDAKSNLNIYYPFLKDSIDEEYIARFVRRKFNEENLIDLGSFVNNGGEFQLDENDISGWKKFLRKPIESSIGDPYPVLNSHFEVKQLQIIETPKIDVRDFYAPIANVILSLDEFNPIIYEVIQDNQKRILIDPTINSTRKQPVLAEIVFDSIGTGMHGAAVYALQLKTPIASLSQYKRIRNRFYSDQTLMNLYKSNVKLCLDVTQTGGSSWALYMSCSLPLFVKDIVENPLSQVEIRCAFKDLIYCADMVEKVIFERDIKLEHLNFHTKNGLLRHESTFRNDGNSFIPKDWKIHNGKIKREIEIDSNGFADMERQALIWNHQFLYVKTTSIDNKWNIQIGKENLDVQEEEILLLDKHFKVVSNKVKLK